MLDAADLDGAGRNLIIRRQLGFRHVFDDLAFASDKAAGAGKILRQTGAILGDAIVNLDVHCC